MAPTTCRSGGLDYQLRAGRDYVDLGYGSEANVRGRILALIDYLNCLRSK